MARCGNYEGPRGDRYAIGLRDARRVGSTDANWTQFAAAGSNPIRYLTRE
jgi:hypothetical protein